MPALATAVTSAVFTSTQLWPIAAAGSLPVWVRVTSTSVQSPATSSSFLSYCMASLPAISSLQTLSAANAAWVPPANDTAAIASAARTECLRIIGDSLTGTGRLSLGFKADGYFASIIGNAKPLVHDRTGGGVLQKLLLLWIEVVLNAEGRQCGFVEA